jgi:hypothetical protein
MNAEGVGKALTGCFSDHNLVIATVTFRRRGNENYNLPKLPRVIMTPQ